MPSADEIIEILKEEMDRGKGNHQLAIPVSLEPPFIPFDALRPRSGFRRDDGHPRARDIGPLSFIVLKPSLQDDYDIDAARRAMRSLGMRAPCSFELLSVGGRLRCQMAVATADSAAVVSAMRAAYPHGDIYVGQDILADAAGRLSFVRGYGLRRAYTVPLATGLDGEVYRPFTALLPGEVALLQVLLAPVVHDWRGNIVRMVNAPWFRPSSPFVDIPDLARLAAYKVEHPLYAVAVRLAASTPEVLDRLERSFLSQFDSGDNGLQPLPGAIAAEDLRARVTRSHGMILNLEELASLAHIPNPEELDRMALPVASDAAPAPELATGEILIPLGTNHYRGETRQVGLSEEWATRPTFILGGTGYGKTTLLMRFSTLAEAGFGFALLDPKGDAAERMLGLIPRSRLADVVYFNAADSDYPPALNVLEASDERDRERLASDLLVAMRRLFEASWGDRMEWVLLQAIRTLLASTGEKTLRDLIPLLLDEGYREETLATVDDPDLQEFWRLVFPRLPRNAIDPVLNKVSKLVGRPLVRNIVCQPNRIDFHKVMREGKILICNLSKGQLGEDAATLLGTVILSRLQLAALSRPEGARRLYPIIVDEFHNYAGQGADTDALRSFLSEARSFRAPLVMATQYLHQLDRDVLTAIFGNPGTLICLRCGTVDAQILQRELGVFSAQSLLNLDIGQAVVRMGSASRAFNLDIYDAPAGEAAVRDQVVRRSRDAYCRSRDEVEQLLREKARGATESPAMSEPGLRPEARQYLAYAADHPEHTLTQVQQALGLSGHMAQALREQLIRLGYLLVVDTRLGKGGTRAKFPVPTRAGLRLLGKPLPGRGGPVHKHLQRLVAASAETRGFSTVVERTLEAGGSVDVHLERDGLRVGVEISVSGEVLREMRNIQKCLDAGYDRVLCLYLDPKVIDEATAEVARQWEGEEALGRIVICSVDDLEVVLDGVSALSGLS